MRHGRSDRRRRRGRTRRTCAVGFGLYETTDAGRQWALRQPGNWGYLTTYRDNDRTILIAVGPDGSALYAATGAGLRRSTDQGQTWNDTGFDGVAMAVAIAPEDPMDVVVVDQATRFYRSSDGGAAWPPFPQLTRSPSRSLRAGCWHDGPRAAGEVDDADSG